MQKNLVEWFVFGVSVLLILALLVYLGIKASTFQNTPPDLRVEVMAEQDKLQRNVHRVELVNHGEQTAENVKVEVALLQQGKEKEKSEALFPLAPQGSKQVAWVTFKAPAQASQKIEVHIVGYNKP